MGEFAGARDELRSIMATVAGVRHRIVRLDKEELLSCLRAFDAVFGALEQRDAEIARLKAENARLSTWPFVPGRLRPTPQPSEDGER